MNVREIWVKVAFYVVTCVLAALIGAASVHADRTITLTFVRSAQSESNGTHLVDTSSPGPDLTPLGFQQAAAAAKELSANGYDGIYASTMVRSVETATPLSEVMGLPIVVLLGLRQVEAGAYEGQPETDTHDRDITTAWVRGDRSARIPGSVNGHEFNARFDDAVQVIYDSGNLNPVVFSHSTAIRNWVLMNAKNPDISLYTDRALPNLGQVVVVGSPHAGWTLTNWVGASLTR
jgi:broad specificity phosphatase PhoE